MQSVWVGNVAWSLDGGIVSLHSHCSPNARESGILENLAGKIRNPALWNLEYSSRNPESHERLESRIQGPLKKNENLVPSFRNPQRGIQNPRLSWIPLHVATLYLEAMMHRGPIFNLGSYFFESDLNGSTLPPPLVPVNAPFPDTGHIATQRSRSPFITCIGKIQLVVYYQCCILIGWATTRLYVIAP